MSQLSKGWDLRHSEQNRHEIGERLSQWDILGTKYCLNIETFETISRLEIRKDKMPKVKNEIKGQNEKNIYVN